MIWWETWLWQVSFALKFHLSNSERILAEASHGGGIIHCCVSDLPIQLPSYPALPCIKLAHTVPQCMQIWLLMTELWRVFNIVNSELLLPVEIKMLPNNLFHKIFIRGMFTVHPIIPSVRVGVLLTDPFVAGWLARRLLLFFSVDLNYQQTPHRLVESTHRRAEQSTSSPWSGIGVRRLLCANKGWNIILLLTPSSVKWRRRRGSKVGGSKSRIRMRNRMFHHQRQKRKSGNVCKNFTVPFYLLLFGCCPLCADGGSWGKWMVKETSAKLSWRVRRGRWCN